jgi:hypothetical protein
VRSPLLAIAVAAAFGCTTLRAPAGSVDGPPSEAPGILAEPQVELWLESSDAVPQQEADEAQREARAVLAAALADRPLRTTGFDAVDPIVVVRERAVARTSARKTAQTAAKVGLVVGFVAVAVATVLAVVKGGHGGGGSTSSHSAAATTVAKATARASAKAAPAAAGAAARIGRGAAARVMPRAAPIPTAPVRPRPIPAGVPRPVPLAPVPPRYAAPIYFVEPWHPWIAWNIGIWVDLTPQRPPIAEPPVADPIEAQLASAPPPPEEDAGPDMDAAPPPPPLDLPPFASPELDKRGFFDGDEIRLQVAVLDRATGRLLWANESKTDGDPRDRGDIDRALDATFDSASWAWR